MASTPREQQNHPARRAALLGLLFALAIVLALLESLLPPLLPVPGVKPGLANVVVMFCATSLGARPALTLAVLKALFAAASRGAVAAALSLSGGVVSVLVMLLVARVLKRDNVFLLGILGAVGHNVGQLLTASAILGVWAVFWYYLSVLAAAGIGMGLLTGFLFKAVQPLIKKQLTMNN